MLTWIVLFSVLGSIGAIFGAACILLFPDGVRRVLIPGLVSYAAGALLGAAFLGMIPNSLQHAPAFNISSTVLAGLVLFFVLEKLLIWHHCHDAACTANTRPAPLILIGDAFHNFADGVVIAAAFLTSVPLGMATALAVVAHEIPQELGDFAILLDNGYSSRKALFWNTLSASATLLGAIGAYIWLDEAEAAVPYILALSAASFIYIALADLMPKLHQHAGTMESLRQFALLATGIGTIALLHMHR